MKTIKKSISVMLSLLLLLSFASTFAFAQGQTIYWDIFEEELAYAGELSVGTNELSEVGNFAFGFTAENKGVYAINFSVSDTDTEYGYSMALSGAVSDGNPTGSKLSADSEEYGAVYFFEEGEREFFGLTTEGDISSYAIDIQYLGKVEDFELLSNDFQAGFEADLYEDDNGVICEIYSPVTVSTDKETEFTVSYLAFPFEGQSLESGEYTADASLFGFEKEISFSVYRASDYVKDIRVGEGYAAPKVWTDEDGEMEDYYFDENSFAVDFELKDGSFVSNNGENYSFEFTADDGRIVRLSSDIVKGEDGKFYWVVYADFDTAFILSEAEIGENIDPDKPDDDPTENNEFFLITLIRWIAAFIKNILTYLKVIFSVGIF